MLCGATLDVESTPKESRVQQRSSSRVTSCNSKRAFIKSEPNDSTTVCTEDSLDSCDEHELDAGEDETDQRCGHDQRRRLRLSGLVVVRCATNGSGADKNQQSTSVCHTTVNSSSNSTTFAAVNCAFQGIGGKEAGKAGGSEG